MACSEGLASNIEQALDMVPIQMIEVLEGRRKVEQRASNASPMASRPQGTAEDFVAMLGMATGGEGVDVEVIRG